MLLDVVLLLATRSAGVRVGKAGLQPLPQDAGGATSSNIGVTFCNRRFFGSPLKFESFDLRPYVRLLESLLHSHDDFITAPLMT